MSLPRAPEPTRPPPAEVEPKEVARLCVQTAVVLVQHGAESALVETLARRLGHSLGAETVEAGIFANCIVLTTRLKSAEVTFLRRTVDRGINMHVVVEVQRAVLSVERGELGAAGYRERLDGIVPLRYPRWLVSLAIGLSCASFARLAGADLTGCGVVVVASAVAQYLRLQVARLHFSPVVGFFLTAFVATSVAGLGEVYGVGKTPTIALASCVLLLVPGFPLINGVSDLVKGYMNMGISRLAFALLLAAASTAGMLLAVSVWGLWGLS